MANLASIVNCYLHHQGAAASQEVEDKLYKKDFETPDDDHSNEHQSQVSSGLLSAFLDSFKDPMVGQAPNVTIAVGALSHLHNTEKLANWLLRLVTCATTTPAKAASIFIFYW